MDGNPKGIGKLPGVDGLGLDDGDELGPGVGAHEGDVLHAHQAGPHDHKPNSGHPPPSVTLDPAGRRILDGGRVGRFGHSSKPSR
jgi:hypothetical protein